MPKLLMLLFSVSVIAFMGCRNSAPLQTVPAVDLNRYMGTWFEIARFPHRFEKNLSCVTATYSLLENGKVKVVNKGFNKEKNRYKTAEGKAWVPDSEFPGRLKVRFFWPFAGDYYIIDLDDSYSRVLVGAPDRKYLWILARDKDLEKPEIDLLTRKAASLGFDTSKLQLVSHDCE